MSTAEQQPIFDLPGLSPDAYARWRASEVGAITERLERQLILDLIGEVRDRRILDVGCGDGDLAVHLAKCGAHVVGVDASSAMIEAAMQRASREHVDIEFRIAAAQHPPFPPNSSTSWLRLPSFALSRMQPPSSGKWPAFFDRADTSS
jgi:SAM-dependent methyltransferase